MTPIERPTGARSLFLVGFMGCGKSTVGPIVAHRLGWSFVGTDEIACAIAGQSVAEIFARAGEDAFRELERRALRTLADRERCVVATGGGLFTQREARRFIRSVGVSVWLDGPAEAIRRRVVEPSGRPLWDARDEVAWRGLFEKRRAIYALADVRVAAGEDAHGVASRLLDRLRDRLPLHVSGGFGAKT